jgi:uncharacterized peroxidase-related enzyme
MSSLLRDVSLQNAVYAPKPRWSLAIRVSSKSLHALSTNATVDGEKVHSMGLVTRFSSLRSPMSFFKSLPDDAGPANIFTRHPEIYSAWSGMSEALMNGLSPLSQAERELILAYAAGVAGCRFVYVAHSEVAYARGVERGLVEQLLEDIETAPVEPRLRSLLAYVRKLMLTPGQMSQADADAAFDAGWDEHALHDAIAVTARAAFMQRLVEGHGFIPMTRETAAKRARDRVELGYVNLYPTLRDRK